MKYGAFGITWYMQLYLEDMKKKCDIREST